MKVHFRTYCYGCRQGARWHGRCLWRRHRWEWAYFIECDGQRLASRQGFRDFDRAVRSAQRSWYKLTAVSCITTGEAS